MKKEIQIANTYKKIPNCIYNSISENQACDTVSLPHHSGEKKMEPFVGMGGNVACGGGGGMSRSLSHVVWVW